jgi:zinc/manganese transport system ATP-binding protein
MNGAIAFDAAGVRYGETWIWRDVSFEIAPGAFAAVVGPNGAGKSTLLKTLLGLLPLAAGAVTVGGEPPRRGNPSIGYMPQSRPIEPELAIRGIDIARFGVDGHRWGFAWPGKREAERTARVRKALAAVGAEAYARRRLGAVSGGEAQRLFLAQALVGNPALLILDEPLANLDLANRAAMLALIAEIRSAAGMTVLLVAHDINGLLPYLDTVVYVANGCVAAGAPHDVITSAALSRIYNAEVEVLHDRYGRRFVVVPDPLP